MRETGLSRKKLCTTLLIMVFAFLVAGCGCDGGEAARPAPFVIKGIVAGDSPAFAHTAPKGSGLFYALRNLFTMPEATAQTAAGLTLRAMDFMDVTKSPLTNLPIVAIFAGNQRLGATVVGADGSYTMALDPSLVLAYGALFVRFYDRQGGVRSPGDITTATPSVAEVIFPIGESIAGLKMELDAILTRPTVAGQPRDRIIARYSLNDGRGIEVTYDNGVDTNNDGTLGPDDACSRMRFSDGFVLFDRNGDSQFGEAGANTDAVSINRNTASGTPDPAPLVNGASIVDSNLDGVAEPRTGTDPQDTVGSIELSAASDSLVGNGVTATTVTAAVFPNARGIPLGANLAFSLQGPGQLSPATGIVGAIRADGSALVRVTYTAGSLSGASDQRVTLTVTLAGRSLQASHVITLTSPNKTGSTGGTGGGL